MRILLAEDRTSLRSALAESMERAGYDVEQAAEGKSAMSMVEDGGYDCAVFDLKMPVHNGMELLRTSRALNPLAPVVLLTAYGSVETAVTSMKEGAFDFIQKPVDTSHLLLVIQRALEESRRGKVHAATASDLSRLPSFQGIRGSSRSLVLAQQEAARVAATDAPCLILGETGVGKELFARAIHDAGKRKKQPFVAVNCAAIPETLLENELFGHEKGAYTGAHNQAIGKFEYAHRGTIFMDEIGEMGTSLQAKLLRVLEDGRFTRIGGTQRVVVDVRLLCATNRNLDKMVELGEFRRDLYYRLNVFPILIPPLRERREDIPELAEYFAEHYRKELALPRLELAEDSVAWLSEQPWPGNVRQLMNQIERAAILVGGDLVIRASQFENSAASSYRPSSGTLSFDAPDQPEAWIEAEAEWRAKEILKRCNGDTKRAAALLGISPDRLKTLSGK